ncbi:hypothetical protein ACFQQB_44835 [Nonomuraea rubra]
MNDAQQPPPPAHRPRRPRLRWRRSSSRPARPASITPRTPSGVWAEASG